MQIDMFDREGARPSLYTIPGGAPFLDVLVENILGGEFAPRPGACDPLDLARYTVLLPTRRACRALSERFLSVSGGDALLLPRIRPVAETDENEGLLQGLSVERHGAGGFDVAPSVSELERRLVLSQLVLKWSEAQSTRAIEGGPLSFPVGSVRSPAQAVHLGIELANLIDLVETEEGDFSRLDNLVPEAFSEHWQVTLDFLKIVTEFWPNYLDERQFLSPAERRNRLLAAEAERLRRMPPGAPYIIAGVTGSVPATARLMTTVAGLANCAVVLPALDCALDETTWQTLAHEHPEHPQHGLAKLLRSLGVERAEVKPLGGMHDGAAGTKRMALVTEAMRPAPTTGLWHTIGDRIEKATTDVPLEGLTLVEADTSDEEARVVALILRGAVEDSKRSAALVTPDRNLARRVAVKLEAWGLRIDDSAGRPLEKTVPGAFLDLILDVLQQRVAPASLTALLKHPLTRLGLPSGEIRNVARALELIVFRQPYLGEGFGGVRDAVGRARRDRDAGLRQHSAAGRLDDEAWDGVAELVEALEMAFEPLSGLQGDQESFSLGTLARAHALIADALARADDDASSGLWSGEAGEAAAAFLAGLMDEAIVQPSLTVRDYPEFFRSLVRDQVVRPRVPAHPRLFIWGPYEARLQLPDVVVLGSLNDGTCPAIAQADAWLSRPMRAELGLPAPEQQIGFAAHDFAQLLGAKEVYLTRAAKIDGVPTVRSRWLLRFDAVLAALGYDGGLDTVADGRWLAWARTLDGAERQEPIAQPAPCPLVKARPRRMSVTEVETWMANPYAIFARRILRLEPIAPLGAQPDAAIRGMIIHQTLHGFVERFAMDLPDDAVEQLTAIASGLLSDYGAHPRVTAFWVPRFRRFASWFAETEPERRRQIVRMATELRGRRSFDAPAGRFELTARADRIDERDDGRLVIYDYKTGAVANNKQVAAGRAPQLPLEAAIALAGGFPGIEPGGIAGLTYIRATGGEPPGEEHPIKLDDPEQLAEATFEGLCQLVALFDQAETPYRAMRRAGFENAYRFDDYAHLARVDEWWLSEDGGNG